MLVIGIDFTDDIILENKKTRERVRLTFIKSGNRMRVGFEISPDVELYRIDCVTGKRKEKKNAGRTGSNQTSS